MKKHRLWYKDQTKLAVVSVRRQSWKYSNLASNTSDFTSHTIFSRQMLYAVNFTLDTLEQGHPRICMEKKQTMDWQVSVGTQPIALIGNNDDLRTEFPKWTMSVGRCIFLFPPPPPPSPSSLTPTPLVESFDSPYSAFFLTQLSFAPQIRLHWRLSVCWFKFTKWLKT